MFNNIILHYFTTVYTMYNNNTNYTNKLNTSNYLFVMTSIKIKYNFLNNCFYKTIPFKL